MGKTKYSIKEQIEKYRHRFGPSIFKSDSLYKHLVCSLCNEALNLKCSTIRNHCQSNIHKQRLKEKTEGRINAASASCNTQSFIPDLINANALNGRSKWNAALCKALVCSSIPLWKLTNKVLRNFVEKWTNQVIPCE